MMRTLVVDPEQLPSVSGCGFQVFTTDLLIAGTCSTPAPLFPLCDEVHRSTF